MIERIKNDIEAEAICDELMTKAMEAIDNKKYVEAFDTLIECAGRSDSIERRTLCLSLIYLINNSKGDVAHMILQGVYSM